MKHLKCWGVGVAFEEKGCGGRWFLGVWRFSFVGLKEVASKSKTVSLILFLCMCLELGK